MKTLALITATVVFTFLLFFLNDSLSAEHLEHHEFEVDNSGDPNACIACHDGVSAPYARYCTTDCSAATAHSILKEYPPSQKVSSYAPVESLLEKGIRLFNGKVACISCHDLKNNTENHLVIDNRGSALCFSCHLI